MEQSTPNGHTPAIPLIDFTDFAGADLEAQRELGRQMVQVCHDVGFCYIKHHGIAADDVHLAFTWTQKFYDLPTEKKQTVERPTNSDSYLGWHAPGALVLEEGYRDMTEQFNFNSDEDKTEPSKWLREDDLPGFHAWSQEFYGQCWNLADKIMTALSLGLGLDKDFLSKVHDPNTQQAVLKYYPPVSLSKLKDGSLRRLSPHTDFCSFTLLFQHKESGLQVESNGKFVDVPPVPDTVVMNIGEVFTRWTNNYLKSTNHCVGIPRSLKSGHDVNGTINVSKTEASEPATRARYSIPFFLKPKWDVVLEPMPGFVEEQSSTQYIPITFQQFYNERVSQNRELAKAT